MTYSDTVIETGYFSARFKTAAKHVGCKTIGEFENYLINFKENAIRIHSPIARCSCSIGVTRLRDELDEYIAR